MALTCPILHDQRIAPHRFLGNARWEMGVYDRNDRVTPASLLHRSYARGTRFCLGVAAPPRGQPGLELDTAIYGGMLVEHFGHFLTESLARLWAAAETPGVPILMTLPRRMTEPRLLPWQSDVLSLLGVADRVIPLTRLARVRQCLLPDPGYEIQFTFAGEQADFLGRIPWRPQTGHKVWISRARLGGPNQPAQAAIDAALRQDGWTVVHPESLSLRAQLDHYAQAERLAGEEGSALHAVMFLTGCAGLRLDMLVRDPRQTDAQINANQATLCAGRAITLRIQRVPGETVVHREGAHVDKTYAPPGSYVACLRESGAAPLSGG